MDKIVDALSAQQDDLSALLTPLDATGWQTPSRCPGWTVADVVLHLAQTNELAIASLRGRFPEALAAMTAGTQLDATGGSGPGATGGPPAAGTVDDGAAAMVARERGRPPDEVLDRWYRGAVALRDELNATDPDQRVVWVAGEMRARTLATTRLAETWIHTGDVAIPLGQEPVADDRLWHISRLAWRTLPYAFAQAGRELAGPVAFELGAPNGDTWHFVTDDDPVTTIEGPAIDLCTVAARRADAADTRLAGRGPDAAAVLELVRTFA